MSRCLTIGLLLLSQVSHAQWRYQIGLGWNLGTGDHQANFVMSDTLQYDVFKSGLSFVSGSFMATYPINEKLLFRTGFIGAKTVIDIEVVDQENQVEMYWERRSITEVHVPAELQYELTTALQLNGGFSLNGRLEPFRESYKSETFQSFDKEDEEIIVSAYNAITLVSANFRFGTTVKFTRWLGLDLIYDRPMMNLIPKPFTVNGDKKEVKFKYSTLSLRMIYIFDWQKVKAALNG